MYKASEVPRFSSVIIKWVLLNIARLSVLKSVVVVILTYGHESWVMTDVC